MILQLADIKVISNDGKEYIQVAFYDDKLDNFFLEKSSKEPNPYITKIKDDIILQNIKAEKLYKKVISRIKNSSNKKVEP